MTRQEVLNAVQQASEIFQKHMSDSSRNIDLISVADELGVPILFRPLDNLVGGAVSVEDETGILIQASQPLHRQRFTIAHELGHIVLGHNDQLDDQINVNKRAHPKAGEPIEEVAANVFASELLAPLDIIRQISKTHKWSKSDLQNPSVIYQLSLRLCISFTATCWALNEHDVLSRQKASEFTNDRDLLRELKGSIVPGDIERNPWANVWQITKEDDCGNLLADKQDIFVVGIEENSASGYIWQFSKDDDNIEVLSTCAEFDKHYGSESSRQIVFRLSTPEVHSITITQSRPWNDETIESLTFSIDNRGKEREGLPRDTRQKSLAEAKA
jgi:Zn-dependent peptidase ImmA (M78 family)/predicted secreted protein